MACSVCGLETGRMYGNTAHMHMHRETIEEALENDRCGICGSVDHFREDHPQTSSATGAEENKKGTNR